MTPDIWSLGYIINYQSFIRNHRSFQSYRMAFKEFNIEFVLFKFDLVVIHVYFFLAALAFLAFLAFLDLRFFAPPLTVSLLIAPSEINEVICYDTDLVLYIYFNFPQHNINIQPFTNFMTHNSLIKLKYINILNNVSIYLNQIYKS